MRRFILLLLACVTVCLAGCSDQSGSGNVDVTDRTVPVPYNGPTPSSTLLDPSTVPAPTDASSDPVMHDGSAPLAAGRHALESDDPIADADPLGKSHDLSSQDDPLSDTHSGERNVGWYWLRGTVQNGTIAVVLNGATCGEFSDFTDREVTRYVRPGMNRVTFTSVPTSSMRPFSAHFVVYMRAASADVHETVPAAVYDRVTASPLTATLQTTPVSAPASPLSPQADPSAVTTHHVLPQPAASETRVLTFFAK